MKPTKFRVMKSYDRRERVKYDALPDFVPFALVVEHAEQCMANHQQTPQRLNERGGLDPHELVCVLSDKDWDNDIADESVVAGLLQILADWENKSRTKESAELHSQRSSDPIFTEGGVWFFWDETWSGKHGPFKSEEEARATLKAYAENL